MDATVERNQEVATIIRAAHLTDQPRILPVRPISVAESAPSKTAPLDKLPSFLPTTTSIPVVPSSSEALRPIAAERPPLTPPPPPPPYNPRLSPEREAELMEESRLAREQAVQEGYQEGFAEGSRVAREALDEKKHALETLLRSTQDCLHGQISGLEDVIVSLAFESLCKILGTALHDQDGVRAIVQEVISRSKNSEPLTIRVSPSDYYLLAHEQISLQQSPSSQNLSLIADERVGMGGCLVETSGGTLDGRLETQLHQLKEALLLAKRQRPDWKEPSSAF